MTSNQRQRRGEVLGCDCRRSIWGTNCTTADARSSVPCHNWPAPWSSPNRGSATWCSPVYRVSDELCSFQKIRGLGPKALQSSAAWPALILVAVIGHMVDPKSRVSPSHAVSPILASMISF